MNCILMKRDHPVAFLNLMICLNSIVLIDYKIIDYDNLPYIQKIAIKKDQKNEHLYIQDWIDGRCVPNNRTNLDFMVINAMNIKNHSTLGRMVTYQQTIAFLSHFMSGFDDYYITPIKNEFLYFALESPYFTTLYSLETKSWKYIESAQYNASDEIKNLITSESFFDNEYKESSAYTIPSIYPSWWEEDHILTQQVSVNHDTDKLIEKMFKNNQKIEVEEINSSILLVKNDFSKYENIYMPYAQMNYMNLFPNISIDDFENGANVTITEDNEKIFFL